MVCKAHHKEIKVRDSSKWTNYWPTNQASPSPSNHTHNGVCVFFKPLTPDLDGEVLGHHAVPGRQVSMDELVGVEVGHAIRDLSRHLDHLLQRGQRQTGRVLEQRRKLGLRLCV